MAGKKYPESHKLILFVEKAPFSAEEKTRLIDLLNANGMTEEIVDEVHKSLAALPKDQFADDWQHARINLELSNISKQWQLSHGSKNFKHAR
jgi:hypothetical protein